MNVAAMRDQVPDPRKLKYALAATEHGSFRRAAEALGVEQSTISRGVRDLEHEVGAMLFVRSTGGVRPTAVGEMFLREASAGAEQFRQALMRVASAQRGDHGDLKIGASIPLEADFLREVFARIIDGRQGIRIEVTETTADAAYTSVLRQELDIAFTSGTRRSRRWKTLHLWDEPLRIAMPASHRLSKKQFVRWADLRNERFIACAPGTLSGFGDRVARELKERATRLTFEFHNVGYGNLLALVASGFGIAVAQGGTYHHREEGRLAFVDVEGNELIPNEAIWLANNPNPALQAVLKVLRDLRREIPPSSD